VHGRARAACEPPWAAAAIASGARVVLTTPWASVAVRLTVAFNEPRVITVSCGSLPLQIASGRPPPVRFQL
jgi:hypothetical protein